MINTIIITKRKTGDVLHCQGLEGIILLLFPSAIVALFVVIIIAAGAIDVGWLFC